MNNIQRALFSVLIIVLPAPAWSATAIIGASRDNTIYQNSVSNSAGGAAGIFVGTNGQGSPRRGLIAFDVAGSVPSGATITSAQVSMYLGAQSNTNGQTVSLHRLIADWGEGTAGSSSPAPGGGGNGFAASAGDATWNERFLGSAAWTNPGAAGDFNSVASASALVGGPLDQPHTWASTAALLGDVQNWLDTPARNFGWALVNGNETASQTVKVFYSRSATLNSVGGTLDTAWRPTLTVTYVIPEPAAVILLLLAAPLPFVCRLR
jgi:hypothetical protein